jgi:hypothetical protein
MIELYGTVSQTRTRRQNLYISHFVTMRKNLSGSETKSIYIHKIHLDYASIAPKDSMLDQKCTRPPTVGILAPCAPCSY